MIKSKYFPVIYGIVSALIAYIAIFFVCFRSFHYNLSLSMGIASIGAVIFFIISYFRAHASREIKRITAEYRLTDTDLAKITGMKKSDFPIYNNQLQLILPKRYWPKVLDALQKYEKSHEK